MDTSTENAASLRGERRLGQHLHAFSNMVQSHFHKRTEQPIGIALPEWRVLRATILAPRISQADVAAGEGINVMSVSRAVAGLKQKKLIDVEPDPDDRRRTMLSPTELGAALGADIAVREQVIYQHLFSVLTEAEQAMLDEMMARVNENVANGHLPPTPPPTRDWATILASVREG